MTEVPPGFRGINVNPPLECTCGVYEDGDMSPEHARSCPMAKTPEPGGLPAAEMVSRIAEATGTPEHYLRPLADKWCHDPKCTLAEGHPGSHAKNGVPFDSDLIPTPLGPVNRSAFERSLERWQAVFAEVAPILAKHWPDTADNQNPMAVTGPTGKPEAWCGWPEPHGPHRSFHLNGMESYCNGRGRGFQA